MSRRNTNNIMASNLMVQIILSGKSVSSLHSIKLVTAKIELDLKYNADVVSVTRC